MRQIPTVASCISKGRSYYEAGNPCGGALHIVLDDGNVERSHVEWCLAYAKEIGDADAFELAQDLLELTDAQREEVYEQFWAPHRIRSIE